MTFHIYQPTTDEFVNFKREIKEMRLEQFNWTMPEGEDVSFVQDIVFRRSVQYVVCEYA